MKEKLKGLVAGLAIGSLLGGTVAYAGGAQIEVVFRQLTIMFDGAQSDLAAEEGFLYQGRAYVPIRFVGEALGKAVEWDESTGTIWVGKNTSKVVAVYAGGRATLGEFDRYLAVQRFFNPAYAQYETLDEYRDFMIRQLIKDQILFGRAAAEAVQSAETAAEAQISAWQQQNAEAFAADLATAGLTLEDVRSFLVRTMAGAEAVKQSISEASLQAAYEQRLQSQPDAFTVATVRHILIGFTDSEGNERTKEAALARAEDVLGQLEAGGDMASLAEEYSDDGGSKGTGGLYADAPVTNWVAAFRQAAVELPVGALSDPVETEFGYHIMRVEARTVRSLDETRVQLQEELQADAMNRFMTEELPGLIERIDLPKPE